MVVWHNIQKMFQPEEGRLRDGYAIEFDTLMDDVEASPDI